MEIASRQGPAPGLSSGSRRRSSLPLHCTRLTVARGRSKKSFAGQGGFLRMPGEMRLSSTILVGTILLAIPLACRATSCVTQAELSAQDRAALSATGGQLSQAVVQQAYAALQAALLPAEAAEWDGIRGAVEASAPLMKGGQVQLRNVYLLDATSLTAPADTQFFCSNTSGSLTVTVTMRRLPPGRYAVVLADAAGAALGGQMGLILAWDGGSALAWRLGGVSVRQGVFEGHDGAWYWKRARELAKENLSWGAWYCYDAARTLLVPVDFLSSP